MSHNRILADLPSDLSQRFAEELSEVVLKQSDVIVARSGALELIYFPVGCLISMVVDLANGNTVEALTVGNDGFADSAAFFGKTHSTFKGIVQISGASLTMPLEAFSEFLSAAEFRQNTGDYVERAMALMAQSSACLAFHPVEQRLARWLLEVQDRVETTDLRLTHEFLSQMLGVQRPTATIAVNMLVAESLISHRRGAVAILDRRSLEEAACECYSAARANADSMRMKSLLN
jgi:CRP-like cAMP-binding protein